MIVEDSLGIGDELEAAMANHVATYEDEWTATVNDPQRMAKFVSFINAPGVADPELAWVPERGQMRPAGEMDTHTAPDPVRARELAMISMGATSPMGDSVEGEETRA